jgi:hypothetical protein
MIIDCIVFLRIRADRGEERDEQLKEIAEGKGVYTGLCQLFQRADARYNSGLFRFKHEYEARSRRFRFMDKKYDEAAHSPS